MTMSLFWHVWRWFSGFASGIFILLVGYRILPVLDDSGFEKFGKLLRVFGFACILISLFLVVLDYVA
jgi:hypothetical protein